MKDSPDSDNFPCKFLPSEKASLIVFIILDSSGKYKECSFPTDVKMAASLTIEAIPPFLYPFLYMDAEIIWSLFPQQQLQQVQLSLQSPEQRCEPG